MPMPGATGTSEAASPTAFPCAKLPLCAAKLPAARWKWWARTRTVPRTCAGTLRTTVRSPPSAVGIRGATRGALSAISPHGSTAIAQSCAGWSSGSVLLPVRLHDLPDDPRQIVFHLPVGKMPANLAQVRDVADVIADAVLRLVAVLQRVAHAGQQVDGLQNGNAVFAPATQVVHLTAARRLVELQKQVGHIVRVNLVADLLSLVAVNLVLLPGHRADDDVRQVAVQFDGGMLRPGETAAAKNADGHLEIAAKFLAHHVGGHFGGAEDRMQAVVDRHVLVDAVQAASVMPALLQFLERQVVRTIAVYFVGAGEAERGILAVIARRHQHIHRAHRIEIGRASCR